MIGEDQLRRRVIELSVHTIGGAAASITAAATLIARYAGR